MALVRTTLSSACALLDKQITVASLTSIAIGRVIRIDGEEMAVSKGYTGVNPVPVLRAQGGTAQKDHVVTAGVAHGLAIDFDDPGAQVSTSFPTQRVTDCRSITASSTLELPPPGVDLRVILNGTSVIALTIPVPTVDMDLCRLLITSNGAAAHTLTFTGGLSGAGASYDVITVNATAPAAFEFIAANGLWMAIVGPAMGGVVTNLIGSVA